MTITTTATCLPRITITRSQWEAKKRHGYTIQIKGVPYILAMHKETGGTCLQPVQIKGQGNDLADQG